MLDLDMVVVDDDALGHQLQDRLPLGDACGVQSLLDARAEGGHAVHHRAVARHFGWLASDTKMSGHRAVEG